MLSADTHSIANATPTNTFISSLKYYHVEYNLNDLYTNYLQSQLTTHLLPTPPPIHTPTHIVHRRILITPKHPITPQLTFQ